MSDDPWLTILGLGEDGPGGLPPASVMALKRAEIVLGAARHLQLLPDLDCETRTWPVPFADGIEPLLALRGQSVVVLASGDPFWFGAGTTLTRHLDPGEWRALPGPSTFSLAAAQLGWPLEHTVCLGLHAAPLTRLRPHLAPGNRGIVLVRDGDTPAELGRWLVELGFGETSLWIMEALGGPRQRVRSLQAADPMPEDISHPVCVAFEIAGKGEPLPVTCGKPDTLFDHDGQITKHPVRALTLSALAPRPGEHLWDIGAGSGSVSIEWLLAHRSLRATAIEADPSRAARIRSNADRLGCDHLTLVTAKAPDGLTDLPRPDAVFVGGGLSDNLLTVLWDILPNGTRIVANAVTLESESLLCQWHQDKGGDLLRIELAQAQPLGSKRGWRASYPIVQWSAVR